LRGFERVKADLDGLGAKVVSVSVDKEATTTELVEKYRLTFPVGYGADAHHLADLTGAFVNPDPVYLQATGFVINPEGIVMTSVYSSGAIGRLTADDTVGLIRYAREHGA
ncbi:MAG: peroxiredoxin family protein, partial [Actinomycetota bacterium]|nr:peroxiredoxin family protein [Actinomycetota bacterium]